MLTLSIRETELYDERANRFIQIRPQKIELEHSLLSISKWESKWKKAFLSPMKKTAEETLDYIRCMTVTPRVDPNVYLCLTEDDIQKVQNYIDDPMTATIFRGEKNKNKKGGLPRVNTSERIYASMIVLGIDKDYEKWHLNRLLTLIHECEIQGSGKRMSKGASTDYMMQLNAMRRAKHHTRG
jgi:hypothetical protein